MKKLTILLLAAVTAVFALSVAAPAVAKKGKHHHAHALVGIVQAVGADSITLQVKKNKTVTVTVNADTKIVVNGQAATLADIQIGYRALVRGKKGEPAKLIRAGQAPAAGTIVRGLVASVGSDSITVKTKDGTTTTIAVNADTKIHVNRKAATLADVKVGYHVVVVRTAADGPAKAISASKAHAAHGAHSFLEGVVDSVGADSITVKLHNGTTVTVSVTPATRIHLMGHEGAAALSDIQAGFRVVILRAGNNGVALAILAAPAQH